MDTIIFNQGQDSELELPVDTFTPDFMRDCINLYLTGIDELAWDDLVICFMGLMRFDTCDIVHTDDTTTTDSADSMN